LVGCLSISFSTVRPFTYLGDRDRDKQKMFRSQFQFNPIADSIKTKSSSPIGNGPRFTLSPVSSKSNQVTFRNNNNPVSVPNQAQKYCHGNGQSAVVHVNDDKATNAHASKIQKISTIKDKKESSASASAVTLASSSSIPTSKSVVVTTTAKVTAKRSSLLGWDAIHYDVQAMESLLGFCLHGFQRAGVDFIWSCLQKNHGALIAFDMGLGKTIVALIFIFTILQYSKFVLKKQGKVLIVAPLATIYDAWLKHLKMLFKDDDFLIFHGPKRHTDENMDKFLKARIIVTTYETLAAEHKRYNKQKRRAASFKGHNRVDKSSKSIRITMEVQKLAIFETSWTGMVCDEAHTLKNGVTFQGKSFGSSAPIKTKAIYTVAPNSWANLALTGTPSSDKPSDLVAIIKFICQVKLKSHKDAMTGCRPPHWSYPHVWKEMSQISNLKMRALSIQRFTKEFMFRKSKYDPDVPVLPKMTNETILVPMRQRQIQETVRLAKEAITLSNAYVRRQAELDDMASTNARAKTKSGGYSKKSKSNSVEESRVQSKARMKILAIFMKMRRVCDSPILESPNILNEEEFKDNATGKNAAAKTLLQTSGKFIEIYKFIQQNLPTRSNLTSSPPSDVDQNGINSNKIVILVHYLETMRCLHIILDTLVKDRNQKILQIDGSITGLERMDILNKFRQPPSSGYNLLLMTQKCGDVGIDLSVGNIMVLFGPSFNTTSENQAKDRIHRPGLKRDARCIRLVSDGSSIENWICGIQMRKHSEVVQMVTPDVSGEAFERDEEEIPGGFAAVLQFFSKLGKDNAMYKLSDMEEENIIRAFDQSTLCGNSDGRKKAPKRKIVYSDPESDSESDQSDSDSDLDSSDDSDSSDDDDSIPVRKRQRK